MPSQAEYEEGLRNLDKVDWKVDYIITHTCSTTALEYIANCCDLHMDLDEMHPYFQGIEQKANYKHWYFGHFHHDFELPNNLRLLYTDMIRIN